MSEKVIKLGVVGLGRGMSVARDILQEKRVRLTAICDRNPKEMDEALKILEKYEYGDVPTYAEFDDMIVDADMDAVNAYLADGYRERLAAFAAQFFNNAPGRF